MSTIQLPFWLVLITGILAVIAIIDRLLTPAVRWFLQRRLNAGIDELNTRLKLKIRPFGLTKRRVLIDRLVHDPEVASAIQAYAKAEDMPVDVAAASAERYAREIVPSFNAYAYFRIAMRLSRWLSTALYRVRLGYSDTDALADIDPDSSVVFVMNHRSNMDYVLVTYLASASTHLSYAVGEWARLPVLQTIIRAMGAYFIRRNARNQLYRKVLAAYVRMATEAGVTQAIFPEGGLSRDGKIRPVKLGLVSYILAAHRPDQRDTMFIPVGLNYDRVLEDRTLIASQTATAEPQTQWQNFTNTLRFLGRNARLLIARKWHRFGYASVSFGKPVSLNVFLKEQRAEDWRTLTEAKREALTLQFGEHLMDCVGQVVPVLPVALVAWTLRDMAHHNQPEPDLLTLKVAVKQAIDRLKAQNIKMHIPRGSRDYEVDVGLRMLTLRKIVTLTPEGQWHITPADMPLIDYYANSISHLLDSRPPA